MDPRVAASGEWGGGLGAVVPAVGDEGPQQVAEVVVVVDDEGCDVAEEDFIDDEEDKREDDVELFETDCFKSLDFIITVAVAVAMPFNALSPTTSISSSSSIVDRRDLKSGSFFVTN